MQRLFNNDRRRGLYWMMVSGGWGGRGQGVWFTLPATDGLYSEHGREIFDEEVDTPTSTTKEKGKKKYVS